MYGRRRALDNVFVERLWRSVKCEEVYLKEYESVKEAVKGLASYFRFYNEERIHQSLNYQTPAAIYPGKGSEPGLRARPVMTPPWKSPLEIPTEAWKSLRLFHISHRPGGGLYQLNSNYLSVLTTGYTSMSNPV